PGEVLLAALSQDDLEPRLVEALPWVVLHYVPFNSDNAWLVREARARNVQNRLGFVVTLARRLAERTGDTDRTGKMTSLEEQLQRSLLAHEDTLCQTFREPQRLWLAEHRSDDARRWNLLTDWKAESLRYVAA